MSQVRIDLEKAFEEFWEKLGSKGPVTTQAIDRAAGIFAYLWREVKPAVGYTEEISISVDKEGKLSANMAGWLLIGAIAVAAIHIGGQNSATELEKRLKQSEEQHNKKVEEIESVIRLIKEKLEIV